MSNPIWMRTHLSFASLPSATFHNEAALMPSCAPILFSDPDYPSNNIVQAFRRVYQVLFVLVRRS